MWRVLIVLRDDPIPLVRMRGRRLGWSLTAEGFRVLGREPIEARLPMRPRGLPKPDRARRIVRTRADAVRVFEGSDVLEVVD